MKITHTYIEKKNYNNNTNNTYTIITINFQIGPLYNKNDVCKYKFK